MLHRLEEVSRRFDALRDEQSRPEVLADRKRLLEISRKLAEIEPVVKAYEDYRRLLAEHDGIRELLDSEKDAELRAMAEEELADL